MRKLRNLLLTAIALASLLLATVGTATAKPACAMHIQVRGGGSPCVGHTR